MNNQREDIGPYCIRLYPIDAGTNEIEWGAEIPDLPGCVGAGDTPEEALAMVKDAQKAWLDVAAQEKIPIPEPTNPYDFDYSGKLTLRLPKSLHRELAIQAEKEGVSLNQYMLYKLGVQSYQGHPSVEYSPTLAGAGRIGEEDGKYNTNHKAKNQIQKDRKKVAPEVTDS